MQSSLDLRQRGEGVQSTAGHSFGQTGLFDQTDDMGMGAHDDVVGGLHHRPGRSDPGA